VCKDDVMMSVL